MTVCTACSKAVYAQELINIDEKPFHKNCLRCAHCNGILSAGKYAAVGGKFYCKPHFKQLFALKGNYDAGFKSDGEQAAGSTAGTVTTGKPAVSGGKIASSIETLNKLAAASSRGGSQVNLSSAADQQLCSVCTKHVYPVDMVRLSEGKQAHQACFKCSECRATLQLATFQHIDGHLFCKVHSRDASARSTSTSNLARASSSQNLGGSNGNLAAAGRTMPAKKSALSASSLSTGGGGFGSPKCAVCAKAVYPMEQLNLDGVLMHRSCLRCGHCNNQLKPGNYAALGGKYFCKPHFKQLFALKGNYDEGFGTRPHKEKWLAKDEHAPAADDQDLATTTRPAGEAAVAAQ